MSNKCYIIYRYVDDILIISQSPEIKTPDFYPKNLELIKSNNDLQCINFLDLNICYDDVNGFSTDLYDKRNDFKFNIAKFQFFNSCLHKNIFKNITLNQLIRINRLCSKKHVQKQIDMLKSQLMQYNYPSNLVNNYINSFTESML